MNVCSRRLCPDTLWPAKLFIKFQRDRGALIASVTHGSREAVVDWIDKITKLNWNVAPNNRLSDEATCS